MEIEAKFVVPDPERAARLLEIDTLAGHSVGPATAQDLTDAYFDTDDRAVWSAGYVCRLRLVGDRRLVSVKSLSPAEAGIHRREELEVDLGPAATTTGRRRRGPAESAEGTRPRSRSANALPALESPAAWPESPARTLVADLVGDRPLVPLFVLSQQRTVRLVGSPDSPVIELSLDRVELSSGDVSETWTVVEAELRAGEETDLESVARVLTEEWGLVPDPRSKFDRGVQLLGLQAPDTGHEAVIPVAAVSPDALLYDVLRRVAPRPAAGRDTAEVATSMSTPAETAPPSAVSVTAGPAGGTAKTTPRAAARSRAASPQVSATRATARGARTRSVPPESAAVQTAAPVESRAPAPVPGTPEAGTPGAVPAYVGVETAVDEVPAASVPVVAPEAAAEPDAASAPRKQKRERPQQWDRDALYEAAAGKLSDKVGLSPEDSMAEAARKTLLFHFLRMLRHEEGTRVGQDIEELHDMRVSTRRMRAAFRVFDQHLDPALTKPFLKGLRATGRTLGAVRDLDVFMEKTQHYLETLAEGRRGELEPLLAVWHQERETHRAIMIRYLDSEDYRRFVLRFGLSLHHPDEWPEAPSLTEVSPTLLRDVVPPVVYERVAEVRAFDGVLRRPDAPMERYHELRIYAKGLRYTLEYFREVLGSEAKSLIDDIKLLQDHLGDLQDAVVSSGVLRTFLAFGTWNWPKKAPEPAPLDGCTVLAVTEYLLYRQEEADRLVRTFPEVWEHVRGGDFSHRVAAAVASL